MRYGVCMSDVARAGALAAAGADYAEVPAARLVALPDDEFEAAARALTAGPVRPEAANLFLPGDMTLTGPGADPRAQDRYLAACMARLERLGVTTLVFGSGRARAVPEGGDRAVALDRIEDFLRRAAPRASDHGVTIVLEPLRRAESNVFNSVGEGAAFLRERRVDGVRLLADLFHMMEEGEGMAALEDAADLLSHAHVADGAARRPPGLGDYDVGAFLSHLRAAGYDGRVSIECRWDAFEDEVGPALTALRAARP